MSGIDDLHGMLIDLGRSKARQSGGKLTVHESAALLDLAISLLASASREAVERCAEGDLAHHAPKLDQQLTQAIGRARAVRDRRVEQMRKG
jgi:hypothetical protein